MFVLLNSDPSCPPAEAATATKNVKPALDKINQHQQQLSEREQHRVPPRLKHPPTLTKPNKHLEQILSLTLICSLSEY